MVMTMTPVLLCFFTVELRRLHGDAVKRDCGGVMAGPGPGMAGHDSDVRISSSGEIRHRRSHAACPQHITHETTNVVFLTLY